MKVSVNKKTVLCFITLLIILEPRAFEEFHLVDAIFNVGKVIVGVGILANALMKKRFKIQSFFFVLLIYRLYMLIPVFVNYGSITRDWIINSLNILLMSLLIESQIDDGRVTEFVKVSFVVLLLFHIINLILIVFPVINIFLPLAEDYVKFNLLGGRTAYQYSGIPLVFVSIIYNYLRHNSLLGIYSILAISCYYSEIILNWTATSLFGMSVLIVGLIWVSLSQTERVTVLSIPHNIGFIVIMLLESLIVIARIQDRFKFLIVNILHRSLTFSDRIWIWDVTLYKIVKSPWIGYGEANAGQIANESWMFNYIRLGLVPAHNQILQTIHDGGIVGFALFLICIFAVGRKIDSCKITKLKYACKIVLYVAYTTMLTETLGYHIYFYLMVALAFYVDKIIEGKDNNDAIKG